MGRRGASELELLASNLHMNECSVVQKVGDTAMLMA